MTIIDMLLQETRINFRDLARREHVGISTVWRWARRGCKGHVLESFSLGGKRFTTVEAFERWVAKTNGQQLPGPATPRQKIKAIERAEKELQALGV